MPTHALSRVFPEVVEQGDQPGGLASGVAGPGFSGGFGQPDLARLTVAADATDSNMDGQFGDVIHTDRQRGAVLPRFGQC
jgi:hypothetical protein